MNGQIKTMKQFLKYLYEEGWLNQNIDEELHVVKAEKLMLQTFTKEQVAALLEQPDEKRLPAPQFYDNATLLETDMRVSELCRNQSSYMTD